MKLRPSDELLAAATSMEWIAMSRTGIHLTGDSVCPWPLRLVEKFPSFLPPHLHEEGLAIEGGLFRLRRVVRFKSRDLTPGNAMGSTEVSFAVVRMVLEQRVSKHSRTTSLNSAGPPKNAPFSRLLILAFSLMANDMRSWYPILLRSYSRGLGAAGPGGPGGRSSRRARGALASSDPGGAWRALLGVVLGSESST